MILIVGGTNHSGTSMVTKTIIDLYGFDPGEYSKETNNIIRYIQFENIAFKNYCKKELTENKIFNGLVDYPDNSEKIFSKFIENLDSCKDYIFKYPKSVFVWDKIMALLSLRTKESIKFIYVQREILSCCKSIMQKSNIDFPTAIAYFSASWKKAVDFNEDVLFIDFDRLKKGRDISNISSFLDRFPKI